MPKQSASSAYAAAAIQQKTGAIPPYAPSEASRAKQNLKLRRKAALEAARALARSPRQNLHLLKLRLSSKYKIAFLKNSEILQFIPPGSHSLRQRLLKSPTRTLSGVSPIALMPPPAPCGGMCTYCPRVKGAPPSYTGYEPTTMRAIQNSYSARKQVLARLSQYSQQGHPTDKCHLIIMGGTFLYSKLPHSYRISFMKEAYEALNGKKAESLADAIRYNEFAPHKAVGCTFETRPDFAFEPQADIMLSMGGTQVELGVQALSDRVYRLVRRRHTVADVIRSSRILKNAGFKVCYHMMPGLFSTPAQDLSYFRRLFSSSDFQPDMLKIYPALVISGTELFRRWKKGEFEPYDTETAAEVIADACRLIPPYVRISRVQRDIPVPLISAGVKNSNLRQVVEEKLRHRGEKCPCIRCREIGSSSRSGQKPGRLSLSLHRIDYAASGGKEIFLSFEDAKKSLLAAFLRLRIPTSSHRQEIAEGKEVLSSIVRELHVYGQEASIGEKDPSKLQHTGLGKSLLAEAEQITKREFGLSRISVISGPGARGYYRKFGYSLAGPYMAKNL
ncbi:MAG: tRNA uridine(34) 5-carboxymethylaminomethyl modification radical SAM/GNAT enzyme Elp3 [Candidatus Micrarchaeota archaeon]|nr:tRNA uridine(34) 5-carboxymethylaminomethyl modification radical SAM/GNAT enzyme Elp3 [Candidatus Micrarchaeota archaeon]